MNGRLLGVDTGKVRIGLAVSNPERTMAFPLTTYQRQSAARDAGYFRKIVEEEMIGEIVIGLPVHLSGREGKKASEARAFGEWLTEVTGRPVIFFDERYTTVEAESHLWDAGLTHQQRKTRRDRVAAQILLQSYIDAGWPRNQVAGPLEG